MAIRSGRRSVRRCCDDAGADRDPSVRHRRPALPQAVGAVGFAYDGALNESRAAQADLDEAEKLADRILVLNGGRIVADGTAAELARRIAGEDEVRWVRDGRRYVERTPDSTTFARDLFALLRRRRPACSGSEVKPAAAGGVSSQALCPQLHR
ncbi:MULTISPECIES: hypothetical protein [unclassified Nonomuraea]|uniref:hypothetical protein n=1 Tax=unclassified Nonomuraea TaxID=2593643 RepID=UPI00191C2DB4